MASRFQHDLSCYKLSAQIAFGPKFQDKLLTKYFGTSNKILTTVEYSSGNCDKRMGN